MKKGLLLGSLITGCGFFSMQASALERCDITLRVDSYHDMNFAARMSLLAKYYNYSSVIVKAGDIVKDIEIPLNKWSHKNPSNVVLQIDHAQYPGAGMRFETGNQLWAADVNSSWQIGNKAINTEVIKKGIISFSGVGPISANDASRINTFPLSIFYRFNGFNSVIEGVPRSWCNETAMHYVNLFVPGDVFSPPSEIYMYVQRAKKTGEWEDLPPILLMTDEPHTTILPVRVPYDIVKKIGIDVPPVLDFGRVDTGVVAKKDFDVRITYVGITGRGRLTFSYAGEQNMEVTVREKSESQDTPLPYNKYIDQLPPDTISLPYQIGVKGNIARDAEQLVRVTFQVY